MANKHNSWRMTPEEREVFLSAWEKLQMTAAVKWLGMPAGTPVRKFREELCKRGYVKGRA